MSMELNRLTRWGAALALLLIALAPVPARAQATGRIAGTVTDSSQRPVANAQVAVMGTRYGALTGPDGRFRIANVPAGTHQLRVQRIGDRPTIIPNVTVTGGQEVTVNVTVSPAAVLLGGVVSAASRRVEKVTDAPATVTSVDADALALSVGNLFAGALKEVKGVDFIQTGMTSVAINARGFNSSFNNRFLMVEDGRMAILPENGLPVGQFTATPKVDLAGMEVLVGPGSALYGPDAANGVLAMRTKDPRQYPGLTLEMVGGSRSYADVQARYAGVIANGRFGYKVSGEYQTAKDWQNLLRYTAGGGLAAPTAAGVREDSLKIPIDWNTSVARGSAAGVWYLGSNRLELNGGMSRTDGVGQTNVGRNQLKGWLYNTLQARWTTPHWYLNAYRSQSQSGESFALNRYAGAQLTNPSKTADELRLMSDWPSNGRMYAAEVQGNYNVPMLLNTSVVFGGQYRADVVSSDRQWLWDRVTGEDVKNTMSGVYAQATTPVMPWMDLVLAGRYDSPSEFDAQWSPKAGVVIKPKDDHAFRVTFNRAYKTPTILQTSFFIPDWTGAISIYGNTGGFRTLNSAGVEVARYGAVRPEENKTWEFGYKGIIARKLYLDATYYNSKYEAFLSPLTIVGNPFTGNPATATWAAPIVNPGNNIPVDAQGRIVNQAATPITPIVLIYYNLGRATVDGLDLGVNYLVLPTVELRANYSTVNLKTRDVVGEATALNSPSTKWTVGASVKEIGPATLGATWRQVDGYYFRSGVNSGVIPTFGTFDANVLIPVPQLQGTAFNLSVSNLFTCGSSKVTYRTPAVTAPQVAQPNSEIVNQDKGCGFGRKHFEMINMPEVGMMAFLGFRIQH
ncbi:MAG TPA: TonB-dependent receptor [Gemmatimonadaceae bacterium]